MFYSSAVYTQTCALYNKNIKIWWKVYRGISAKCLLALKCKHTNVLSEDNVAASQPAGFENCNVECFFFI